MSEDIHVGISNICTALESETVGSKVSNHSGFYKELYDAIRRTDFAAQRIPGQAVINCPEALPYVLSGVGQPPVYGNEKKQYASDFVLREHRGQVGRYLKRKYASRIESVLLVVYTIDGYRNDPETDPNEFTLNTPTHVLVAVIGAAGPRAPLSPGRLNSNLAGGNLEALDWTADEIRAKCKETKEYWDYWTTVAD